MENKNLGLLVGFLAVFCWNSVFAQLGKSKEKLSKEAKDSLYHAERDKFVDDYTHLLTLRTFLFLNTNRINYNNTGIGKNIEYRPNEPFNYGFGFNYRWLGISISFPGADNAAGNLKRGKTQHANFSLYSYGRTMGIELFYNYYKGFYIANPDAINWSPSNPNLPQRPDLSMENIGGSLTYIFNHRQFSMRSSFIQTELQKKSALSFLLRPSFSWYRMDADTSITSLPERGEPQKITRIRHADVVSLTVSPGIGGTVAMWKHLYATAMIFAGPSLQYKYIDNLDKKDRDGVNAAFRTSARLSLGYNSKWFFVSLSTFGETYTSKLDEFTTVGVQLANIRLNIGTRTDVLDKIIKPKTSKSSIIFEKN